MKNFIIFIATIICSVKTIQSSNEGNVWGIQLFTQEEVSAGQKLILQELNSLKINIKKERETARKFREDTRKILSGKSQAKDHIKKIKEEDKTVIKKYLQELKNIES